MCFQLAFEARVARMSLSVCMTEPCLRRVRAEMKLT